MTVSLTIITKNEEANIRACLEPVVPIVDEVVVVDTGSEDKTVRLAEDCGARVVRSEWKDSFSVARNLTVEHATKDWIFWLDADDRVPPSEVAKLDNLFRNVSEETVGYLMNCVCLAADGGVGSIVEHVRLFPRRANLRWKYRVHEQIVPAMLAAGGTFRATGVSIVHTGFRIEANVDAKLARNLRLVELDCAEHPNDPFPQFYRGAMLADLGRTSDAILALEACQHRLQPGSAIARSLAYHLADAYRATNDVERALRTVREARSDLPNDAALACLEAELLVAANELEPALNVLQAVRLPLEMMGANELKLQVLLGELYVVLRDYERAYDLAKRLIERRPGFGLAWLVLADALIGAKKWPEIDRALQQLGKVRGAGEVCALITNARDLVLDRDAAVIEVNSDLAASYRKRVQASGPALPLLSGLRKPWTTLAATR